MRDMTKPKAAAGNRGNEIIKEAGRSNTIGKDPYKHFRAALYIRALDTAPLHGDITPFVERFEALNKFAKVSKVYIETHRDMSVPDETTLVALRTYFNSRGIATSAGITVTVDESDDFKTYCYSDPFYRNKLKEIVTLSAKLFDEIIFDDFFFTNCKCSKCIEAKGEKSWTTFRLGLMAEASAELVIKPARAANPKVEVVIKYPNWYDHFQGLGFNLQDQPPLYEGIYTGNETRDAAHGAQHLQPYESYQVFRYFENIKPGGNRGGWVDPFGTPTLDRYAEQLWLTLFAKSPEITLFDFHSVQTPIRESQRGSWQDMGTSFSFDGTTAAVRQPDGTLSKDAIMAVAAGAALAKVDGVLGMLGTPVGVKVYKPYHSSGEDFLVNHLGMIGLPIDMVPEFPAEALTILLTESARFDADIVVKIKRQLMDGKTVIITTGLLGAIQDNGLKDIVELRRTDRKMSVGEFQIGWNPTTFSSDKPILVPVIEYLTNDSWEVISCNSGDAGTPLFHAAAYGSGKLFILTVPDNFTDLYSLPARVLARISETVAKDLYVRMEAPAKVSLFVYDNDTFIVHSFLDEPADVRLVLDGLFSGVMALSPESAGNAGIMSLSPESAGNAGVVDISIKPHSFRVFRGVRR